MLVNEEVLMHIFTWKYWIYVTKQNRAKPGLDKIDIYIVLPVTTVSDKINTLDYSYDVSYNRLVARVCSWRTQQHQKCRILLKTDGPKVLVYLGHFTLLNFQMKISKEGLWLVKLGAIILLSVCPAIRNQWSKRWCTLIKADLGAYLSVHSLFTLVARDTCLHPPPSHSLRQKNKNCTAGCRTSGFGVSIFCLHPLLVPFNSQAVVSSDLHASSVGAVTNLVNFPTV